MTDMLGQILEWSHAAQANALRIEKIRVTFLIPSGYLRMTYDGNVLIHADDWDRIVASIDKTPNLSPIDDQVWGIPVVKDHAVWVRDTARAWVDEACERWYSDGRA